MLGVLILGVSYVIYRGYVYVNSYYKHEKITGAIIEFVDIVPGQGSTWQSIRTTDEQEIQEVIDFLDDRTVIKLFPNIGTGRPITKNRQELRVELISDRGLTLEYSINSLGEVEIDKGFGGSFANTVVFGGSRKKWFEHINEVFEDKKAELVVVI